MRAPRHLPLVLLALAGLATACDSSERDPSDVFVLDGGELDTGVADAAPDAAGPDAGLPPDAEAPAPDAGAPDAEGPDAVTPDAAVPDGPLEPPEPSAPTDVIPAVPLAGPYGERTFRVPAAAHWASTGLYLRAGEAARIVAEGRWQADDRDLSPEGDRRLGEERGCPKGSLVARTGLEFEGPITCIGLHGEFVAPADGILFVGMIWSTDLGDAYGERLRLEGALDVTVISDGATAPMIRAEDLDRVDLDAIESGVLEVAGDHVIVTVRTTDVATDRATAEAALATLDAIWRDERALRGRAPFREERVRFVEDPSIAAFAYMLASNPIRCVPDLLRGGPNQRILRAAEPMTDIWGFAHELGHVFSFANGTWVYQYNNIEVFPNIFTLHALEALDREAHQPNVDSYCNGRDAWLAGEGTYEGFRADPFLQLCFLMDFTATYGWPFWEAFFADIERTTNQEIPVGGEPEHANTWGFLRDRFSRAAGEDVTPIFEAWRVPLP